MSDIGPGDVVVCVSAEHSLCPYHNLDRFEADPHPELVGKTATVRAAWPQRDCVGLITLDGIEVRG